MSRYITAPDAAFCGGIAVVGLIGVVGTFVSGSMEVFDWEAQAVFLGTFGFVINRF